MSRVNRRILIVFLVRQAVCPRRVVFPSFFKKYKVYFFVRRSLRQRIILLIHTFCDINLISSYLIFLFKKLTYYYDFVSYKRNFIIVETNEDRPLG